MRQSILAISIVLALQFCAFNANAEESGSSKPEATPDSPALVIPDLPEIPQDAVEDARNSLEKSLDKSSEKDGSQNNKAQNGKAKDKAAKPEKPVKPENPVKTEKPEKPAKS